MIWSFFRAHIFLFFLIGYVILCFNKLKFISFNQIIFFSNFPSYFWNDTFCSSNSFLWSLERDKNSSLLLHAFAVQAHLPRFVVVQANSVKENIVSLVVMMVLELRTFVHFKMNNSILSCENVATPAVCVSRLRIEQIFSRFFFRIIDSNLFKVTSRSFLAIRANSSYPDLVSPSSMSFVCSRLQNHRMCCCVPSIVYPSVLSLFLSRFDSITMFCELVSKARLNCH